MQYVWIKPLIEVSMCVGGVGRERETEMAKALEQYSWGTSALSQQYSVVKSYVFMYNACL